MTVCPNCSHESLQGTDNCEACGTSLTYLTGPRPSKSQQIQRKIMTCRIEEILRENSFQVISPKATLKEAIDMFKKNKADIGSLIVFEGERYVGILSERDFLLNVKDDFASLEKNTIEGMYSKKRPILNASDTLAYAVHQMSIAGYRHLPIQKKDKIVGLINVKDIIRYLCEEVSNFH